MRDLDVMLAKVESSYGTDAVPVIATDAHIIAGWTPRPAMYDDVRRRVSRGFAGATPKGKTSGRQGHALQLELSGSGTVDEATLWGSVWLRACLFGAPVATAATEVAYPLVTSGYGSSLSLYGFKDSHRYRAVGYRANGVFNFVADDYPWLDIDGMGLLENLPDSSAPGTPTLPTYPAPVLVNSDNTSFTLGGFAALLRSFTCDLRNKTEYRSLVGQRAIIFGKADDGDRRAAGGTIVIEEPDPAVKSYFADVEARTNVAVELIHGTEAGNIIELGSDVLNLDEPSYSVEQGVMMMTMTYDLVPSAAGNELTLKTR